MARILVIEDDGLLRDLLKKVLSYAGHEVLEAADGLEGLQRYALSGADLVLTDLIMPEKEGLETIQELKAKNPLVKVIAMSGGGRGNALDYLSLARQLGANVVLAKPFSNQDLIRAVDGVLADGA